MIYREPWGGAVGSYVENFNTTVNISVLTNTIFSLDRGNVTFNDGNETGVLLTPGVWDLQSSLYDVGAGTTTATEGFVSMGTAKGITQTGIDNTRNCFQFGPLAAGGFPATPVNMIFTSPVFRVRVAPGTTQTWYAKALIVFATSTMVGQGGIRATKVALI